MIYLYVHFCFKTSLIFCVFTFVDAGYVCYSVGNFPYSTCCYFGMQFLQTAIISNCPIISWWQCLYAYEINVVFYICYINIRIFSKSFITVLLNDYTTCLTFLMRYPANVDINLILRHALHMQMPKVRSLVYLYVCV